jgi:hypothetical protein
MRSSSCRPDKPTTRSLAAAEAPAASNLETTTRIVANAAAEMKPAKMLPPTALAKRGSQSIGARRNGFSGFVHTRPCMSLSASHICD